MGQREAQSSEKNVEWVGVEENECYVLHCPAAWCLLKLLVLSLWTLALLQLEVQNLNFKMFLCVPVDIVNKNFSTKCWALLQKWCLYCICVFYNTVPLVFPFSLIFFFLSFYDKCFSKGFHRKLQINQRWEIGVKSFVLHWISVCNLSFSWLFRNCFL